MKIIPKMPSNMDFFDQMKIGLKLADFQIQQRRLTTNERFLAKTTYGPIKGVKRRSIYGDYYYSFERIPFAKPPIGELRFKAPQPPEPWTKVRNCTNVGPKPLQKHFVFKRSNGSEDCLYLNVYTKNLNPDKPLPVMVWIYGGGFQFGEASRDLYSPDYFMKENIVMIAITYRLGPLGFLTLNDSNLNVPGNAGLKDQVLALRWVKSNCANFGGDSDNITLFGESAGGASTHYMMITTQTTYLFHKAIIMSGNVLAPWAQTPQRNWAFRLAKALGYEGENIDKDIYEFLMQSKGSDIVKYGERLFVPEEKRERIGFSFGPVIEPYVTEDCVVPKNPVEMMRTAWSNDIPLILGGTSSEGLLLYKDTKTCPKLLNELGNCDYVVPLELNLDRNSEICKEFGLRIKNAYYGDRQPSIETFHEYLSMVSHEYFWFPIHRVILSRMKHSSAPTYLYRFDVDSKSFNHMRILSCGKKVRGTCHGDDLSYLFYNSIAKTLKKHSKEYLAIDRMVTTWAHFALTGNPNNKLIHMVHWNPVDKATGSVKCLNISDSLEIIDIPEIEKIKVWESLFSTEQLV